MEKIRKAVFPVCGLDESYSPATKAIPMEMLPVLDRPLVQHAVDDARAAGIEEFIFVTGRNKAVVENYFDFDYELNDTLKNRGKSGSARAFQDDLLAPGKAVFIHQQAHRGPGHAILCARDLIGDEPFAVLLPTMLIKSKTACIKQLAELERKPGQAILAASEAGLHNAGNRVFAARAISDDERLEVTGLLENFNDQPPADAEKEKGNRVSVAKIRPAAEQQKGFDFIEPENAPEKLALPDTRFDLMLAGRYIFPPAIFEVLASQKVADGEEIQLNDAIAELAGAGQVLAHRFEGIAFDCATQSGLVTASMFYALDNEAISEQMIAEFIRTRLRARIGDLLDANALAELADTLQKVADKRA